MLVDDYDLVAGAPRPTRSPSLLDLLPQARDVGLHLVVARRTGGASRAVFEPVLAAPARARPRPGIVMSGSRDEGVLLGTVRPGPQPPGRGLARRAPPRGAPRPGRVARPRSADHRAPTSPGSPEPRPDRAVSDGPTVAVDLGVTTVAAAVDAAPAGRPRRRARAADGLDPSTSPAPTVPLDLAAVFAPADGTALASGPTPAGWPPTDPVALRADPAPAASTTPTSCSAPGSSGSPRRGARSSPGRSPGRARCCAASGRATSSSPTRPAGTRGRREVLRRAGLRARRRAHPARRARRGRRARRVDAPAGRDVPRRSPCSTSGRAGPTRPCSRPSPGAAVGPGCSRGDGTTASGATTPTSCCSGHLLSTLADEPTPGTRRVMFRLRGATPTGSARSSPPRPSADRRHRQVLLDDVRAAKEQLSDAEQAAVPLPGRLTAAWLSRGELTEVLRPSLRRVVDLLAETLADAGTGPEHLDGVWLTGGGARIPLLAALVHRELGVPATVAPEPRLVVVRGALVVAREDEALLGGVAGVPSSRVRAAGRRRGRCGLVVVVRTPVGRRSLARPPDRRAAAGGPGVAPGRRPTPSRPRTSAIPRTTPAWLTPTSSGSAALLPVRRVDAGGRGRRDDDDATAPRRGRRRPAAVPTATFLPAWGLASAPRAPAAVGGPTAPPGGCRGGRHRGAGDPRPGHRDRPRRPGREPPVRHAHGRRRAGLRRPGRLGHRRRRRGRAPGAAPPRGRPAGHRPRRRAGEPPRRGRRRGPGARPGAAGRRSTRPRAPPATPCRATRPRAEFGDREVARYRQDPAPGVRVDWFVVLSSPSSMVSVGCRHGTDDAEATRVLAVCAQVVETLGPAG